MKTVYLSSAYLAPVEYYCKLLTYDHAVIEQHDHYLKQTYRNRCTIAAPDGPLALTVPIIKPDTPKCPMRDIRISDHGNWRHLHWNALQSAYNHTPFFEYYKDDFRPFYEQKYELLMDFNDALGQLICSLIDMEPRISRSDEYKTSFTPDEADFRERIHRRPRLPSPALLPGVPGQTGLPAQPEHRGPAVQHGSGEPAGAAGKPPETLIKAPFRQTLTPRLVAVNC